MVQVLYLASGVLPKVDSYWQRGCANSGPWILIGTAALRIVVGGFLIRTAVKIVTRCAVFFATVHSFF